MKKPDFALTESDRALKDSARRAEHPSEYAPLIPRLPEDIRGVKAIAAYEIARDDPRGKGSCATCHHSRNHWNGLILELPDGSHASLGRVCGEKRHGLKHRELIEAFDHDTNRAEALRQVQIAINSLTTAASYVCAIPDLPQVAVLEKFRHRFERQYRKLYHALESSRGRLMLELRVIDDDAMIDRKRRRDAKADRYTARIKEKGGKEPTRAEVNAHFAGDQDFSTNELTKQESRQTGTFTGGFLFSRFENLHAEARAIAGRMNNALLSLDGATSDNCTTTTLNKAVIQFTKAVSCAMQLIDDLNGVNLLFDATNLSEIIRWANKRKDVDIGGVYKLEDGDLVCEFPSPPHWRVAIPLTQPTIPRGPLSAIYSAIEGAGSTLAEKDAAPDNAA